MICIKATDTNQDLIDRWKDTDGADADMFARELQKRGCTLDGDSKEWTCHYK
jgi:hypothetical protein